MNNTKKELFGVTLKLSPEKLETNVIRTAFEKMATESRTKIHSDFYGIFADLDDLYVRIDDLANEVRSKSLDEAMKFLSVHGIYDISEQQFFDRFMESHDRWEDDFEEISAAYEAIVERTAESDAYRTARRQNRRQWVGYGSKKAVYQADADNLISNAGHGIFNLMAKGVSAIGNAIKKNEIFKNPATVTQVSNGLSSIIMAAHSGVIDAINATTPDAVYEYSTDEALKSEAIIENINKNRIPADRILSSLIQAIESYPYNRNIYVLLLQNFGGDHSRLDEMVSYFGLKDLGVEKKGVFKARLNSLDTSTLESLKVHLPDLHHFAQDIGYSAFDDESKALYQTAAKKAFEDRIASLSPNTLTEFRASLPLLNEYAREIQYLGCDVELDKALKAAIAKEFELETSKYSLKTRDECDQYFPLLEAYASQIEYSSFAAWSKQVRKQATAAIRKPLAKSNLPQPGKFSSVQKYTFATLAISAVLAGVGAIIYLDKTREAEFMAPQHSPQNFQLSEGTNAPQAQDSLVDGGMKTPLEGNSDAGVASPLSPERRPLSVQAQEAIRDGYVEITDPAVKACTDKKVAEFRRENGPDAMLKYDMHNEMAVECGFNI